MKQHARSVVSTARLVGLLLLFTLLPAALSAAPLTGAAQANPDILPQGCGTTKIDMIVSVYRAVPAGDLRNLYNRNLEHAADAIYEMSNCAHIVRTISVYQSGEATDRAHIRWEAKGHPNAQISGFTKPGGDSRILHVDLFETNNFIANDLSARQGGYTIAHEMGHFFYGLYDEYKGSEVSTDPGSPQPNDVATERSVMNSQWDAANAEDANSYAWINFSNPFNFSKTTAQGRVYNASSWETLLRSPDQDPAASKEGVPPRVFFSDLQAVAPPANEAPRIDLPRPEGAGGFDAVNGADAQGRTTNPARALLEIRWIDGNAPNLVVLVFDVSQAISAEQLANLNAGLKRTIGGWKPGEYIVGVVLANDNQPPTVVNLLPINSDQDRTQLFTTLDGITLGGDVRSFQASINAASTLLTGYSGNAATRNIWLFAGAAGSDGDITTLAAGLRQNNIKVTGHFFNSDEGLTTALERLTSETGGKLQDLNGSAPGLNAALSADPDSAVEDITRSLQGSEQDSSVDVDADLFEGEALIAANAVYTDTFVVDDTIDLFEVEVALQATISPTLSLVAPNQSSVNPTCESDQANVAYCFFSVDKPAQGTWTLQVQAGAAQADIYYFGEGEITEGEDRSTYEVDIEVLSQSGCDLIEEDDGDIPTGAACSDQVTYPEPIVIVATVNRVLAISGLNVTATLEFPNGTKKNVALLDNGAGSDYEANDGKYTGVVADYPANGEYTLSVSFNNADGKGALTYAGYQPSRGPINPATGEPFPLPAPQPVAANFERSGRETIRVVGVKADDHGNTTAAASVLGIAYKDIRGRLEAVGDKDLFRIDVPADYKGNLLYIRLVDTTGDIQPRLRLLAGDGSELANVSDTALQRGKYLFVFPGKGADIAGKTFYAEVSDLRATASGGSYTLKAGPVLPSELSLVYLPLVQRQ